MNTQGDLGSIKQRGFALVVTLSLLVLLTVIAVGMLSISSVALRTSSQGDSMATARANARMALMLAVGELQRQAGPDTRITARADILEENNPPVLGVWRSWEGENHDETGRPISPGNYANSKEQRFLKWLVSGEDRDQQGNIPDTATGADKVTLVGTGSVGTADNPGRTQIHLTPTLTDASDEQGAFAWWVGGENIKARLPKPSVPSTDATGQWASMQKSSASVDPAPFGLDSLLSDSLRNDAETLEKNLIVDKAVSLEQANLIDTSNSEISEEFFHDLSVTATGLLTNAATGGWKKDLSLFTENSAQNSGPIGVGGLQLFRTSPEDTNTPTTLPQGSDIRGANSVLYPWSSYRGNTSSPVAYQHAAVASWNNLIDYALLYRETTNNGTEIATNSYPWNDGATAFNFLHEVRILPVIARIQWVYSHFAVAPRRVPGQPAPPAGSLQASLVLTPVITMWNPYNVRITSDDLRFDIERPLPTAFRYGVGTTQNAIFQAITANGDSLKYPLPSISSGANVNLPDRLRYRINNSFTLQPGETRVFSPTVRRENNNINLEPGYNPGQGHLYRLTDDAGMPLVAPGSSTMNLEVAFDASYVDGAPGVGIYLDMRRGQTGIPHLIYRMVYTPEVANTIYPSSTPLASSEPLASLTSTPTSFLTTVFGARMASRTHLASKGLLQSSPLVNYTAMGGKDLSESAIRRRYRGTNHPVNSPFDYSFRTVGINDTNLPDIASGTNRGFIVTGFQASDGLSRCVIAEIPTRPLQSLAELQHWDLRYENPIPPFAFNLIGNSNASPLIAADSVVAGFSDDVNLQHDDSFAANHLLFDDWFLSSIAPDPSNFGTNGRDMETVYTDFINGTQSLPNAAYQPIALDAGGNANDLFADEVDTADSWKTIASRLEVEGMFNVNSTSVTAWRALLGHARNRRVPFITSGGASFSVELSGKTDHAVSRFSVSGESDTSSAGTSGNIPAANEFTGYRILDDELIDALAENIVEQVRLRGPFLSLSEFVNRQLSSGDLALSGAIQAALDEMEENSSTDLYSGIKNAIQRPTGRVPGGLDAEYAFQEAADGEASFGLPGWTRQADILRPIAPILTVRDDTFTIRAYGDARDRSGANITAKAVCEAVVRRTRDYVDPTDSADIETFPTSQQNQTFGRRLEIISFRWLSPSEI